VLRVLSRRLLPLTVDNGPRGGRVAVATATTMIIGVGLALPDGLAIRMAGSPAALTAGWGNTRAHVASAFHMGGSRTALTHLSRQAGLGVFHARLRGLGEAGGRDPRGGRGANGR
jgi:hypothetical protein